MNRQNGKILGQQVFSPREAARALALSAGTLANWRCKRIGPRFYRLGGRKIVYLEKDLAAWMRREPVLTRDSVEAEG